MDARERRERERERERERKRGGGRERQTDRDRDPVCRRDAKRALFLWRLRLALPGFVSARRLVSFVLGSSVLAASPKPQTAKQTPGEKDAQRDHEKGGIGN